jgi:hypothetical protein
VVGLFLLCGAAAIALTAAIDPSPLALGGNGAGARPALRVGRARPPRARPAARSTTATCSGRSSSRSSCCSCRSPCPKASAIAGFAGAALGLLCGLALARTRHA